MVARSVVAFTAARWTMPSHRRRSAIGSSISFAICCRVLGGRRHDPAEWWRDDATTAGAQLLERNRIGTSARRISWAVESQVAIIQTCITGRVVLGGNYSAI